MISTYRKSGINYSLMDPFKNAALKRTGYQSPITEFPDFYLVDIQEGLGSLSQLADDIYYKTGKDFYYQVGWGNAASILNDLSASGAKPKIIKLFVAAGSKKWYADKNHWRKLINGFADAAKFSGAIWNGGETQTLVGVINPKSVVLAGSAIGIIKPKSNILTEEKIEVGDRIIFLSSSGLHTNGITLVRKLLKDDVKSMISSIRNKTIIYSKFIDNLLENNVKIHFISPITGHGLRKIMRAKRQFTYVIEELPKPHAIFRKIQKSANLSDVQMYSDFNMGIGMTLFAPEKSMDKIYSIGKKMSINTINAGYIENGIRKVIIHPLNIEFKGESLQIR